jgi:hypothetical protein
MLLLLAGRGKERGFAPLLFTHFVISIPDGFYIKLRYPPKIP